MIKHISLSVQCRSWEKCFEEGRGGGDLVERNLGGMTENPRKIFEIAIPEIAANASNFKN